MDEHGYGATEYWFDNFEIRTHYNKFPEYLKYTMYNYSKKMIEKDIRVKLLLSTTNKGLIINNKQRTN